MSGHITLARHLYPPTFRNIVIALGDTIRLMKKIDTVMDLHGGLCI